MTTKNENLKKWISFGIPFRPAYGTYKIFPFETLPKIKILKEFENIKTLDDVEKNSKKIDESVRSVTSCYVEVDKNAGYFYVDQQDFIVWYFDHLKGVYFKEKENLIFVADDIPSFLSRIAIENEIARKYGFTLFSVSSTLFGEPTKQEWIDSFEKAKLLMDEESKNYILKYYETGLGKFQN